MAQRPKAKRKKKSQRSTDKEQSERFKETARKLCADEPGHSFDEAIRAVIAAKPRAKTP